MSADQTVRPFWFIPSHGDGRWLGSPEDARPTEFSYLAQVAQAADRLGFARVTGQEVICALIELLLTDPKLSAEVTRSIRDRR